tara:strand:+ start:824 stop:1096 length:273 start_codon:yes stop_codon:yes gene_type:complete
MSNWRLNIKDLGKLIHLVEKKWEEDPEGYKNSVWLNELSVTKSKLYQLWYQEKDKQEIIDGGHSLPNAKKMQLAPSGEVVFVKKGQKNEE